MSANKPSIATASLDATDNGTEKMLGIAEFAISGKAIRPGTGYLGPNGVVRGRPPLRREAKR